jgi:hypothetical protein
VKVGDLVEVYHHVPRHDEGNIGVGLISKGIIVDIDDPPDAEPLVTYMSHGGSLEYAEPGFNGAIVITVKVISEAR